MTWISSKSHQNSIDGRRNFPKSLCQGSWSWCSYPGCSQREPQTDAWLHYSSRKSSWLKMGGGDHVSRVYPAVVRFRQNRGRYLIHLFINVFSKMEKLDVNHWACRVHSHQQHVTIRGAVTFPDMQSTDGASVWFEMQQEKQRGFLSSQVLPAQAAASASVVNCILRMNPLCQRTSSEYQKYYGFILIYI